MDTKGYLDMDLLRFTTAGSVDDGKSTLIGRLMYDSKSIFEDQIEAIEESSKKRGDEHVNLALLTDGLKAEREAGITIDVAYRYFATPNRKFIIADTPGHIEYTRNMVTGASTANLAIILIDARNGVIEQTCRHSFIANMLGIKHIVVCVNKMDLVDFSEDQFEKIKAQYEDFSSKLNVPDIRYIPISALKGDNVVSRSENTSWYEGSTLMETLENVKINTDVNFKDARFPIQRVIRPQSEKFHDFRGFAGKVEGGVFKVGDSVTALPSRTTSTIKKIFLGEKEIPEAYPPMSVTFTLNDEIDITRGDLIAKIDNSPEVVKELDVMLCWMNDKPLAPRGKYTVRHTSNETMGMIMGIDYKLDINSLSQIEDGSPVGKNDICRAKIKVSKSLMIDSYSKNRGTGSIILVDNSTNETVGAGMVI
jgi:sulfate adenylyltransferase subunit 1